MSQRLDASERARIALDLYGVAEAMMRQNLRRRHPEASESEVQERLLRWLAKSDDERDGPWRIRRRQGR